jgi:transposase-like protein
MGNVMLSSTERSSTEVVAKAKRRRFTAEYKQRILREADGCKGNGEIGALLRREGLYSSHLTNWRDQARTGAKAALAPKKRGPAPKQVDGRDERIAELERALAKQTKRAERAEALVEVQKKVSVLLGIALPEPEEPTS